MLDTFITKLVKDLELGENSLNTGVPGIYALPLEDGLAINLTEISNGLMLKCLIAPYPTSHEELFSTQALLGNLFGQGTKGAILGLSHDGKTLTLTQIIEYHIEYKEFKDILEDFINTIDFWREEALKHK